MGYHVTNIEKGKYGEISKIREEYQEFEDAVFQNNPVLELCELCDLIGAIEGYTKNKYNISLGALIKMKVSTQNAFESGDR